MLPDDITRLRHMLDSAREAAEFAAGKSRSDLDGDRMLLLAIIKSIEIIGKPHQKSVRPAEQNMTISLGAT